MKKLIAIIIFFSPFFIFGQQSIDGCYSSSTMGEFNKEVDVEFIKFYSNNTFSYEYSFFEYKYGSGNYVIKEDSLILQFDSWQKKPNKLQIIDSSVTEDDSISIEIRFIREQTERFDIIGINIALYILSGNTKQFVEGSSDIYTDSLKKIKIKKQFKEVYLEIRSLGIVPTVFKISGVRDIRGVCYLYDGYYGKINGEIYRYKIIKKDLKKILLQKPDFEGNDFIQIFKKRNKNDCQ